MLVSLDIKDMFTNINLDKVVNIIEKNRMGVYQFKDQIIMVIKECIQQNYFRFNNKFYIQKFGLPMRSLLSLILAEIFMNDLEKSLVSSTRYQNKLKIWIRYVDDVLIIWEGSVEELTRFIEEANNIDQNIQFKEEVGGKEINYLDLRIKINEERRWENKHIQILLFLTSHITHINIRWQLLMLFVREH